MVNLKFIKTNKCPVCGCDTVISESIEATSYGVNKPEIRCHTNGGTWEYRQFLCGYSISYVPNFQKEINHKRCFNDPEIELEQNQKNKLRDDIIEVIDNSEAPPSYKNKIKQYLF